MARHRFHAQTAKTVTGTPGDDMLVASAAAEHFVGGAGSDFVNYMGAPATGLTASLADPSVNTGWAAGDTYDSIENLVGTTGNDILIGDAGDNKLAGGKGADHLVGGTGFDFATYGQSPVAVDVSLVGSPSANTGPAHGDSFVGIEGLVGTAQDDQLTGDGGHNILIGGAGADRLDGGAGLDAVSYINATHGVTANLAGVGPANTGDAAGDTYVSIEGLGGSNFADRLFGDARNNALVGNGGNDRLDGGAGADHMEGGAGNDTYVVDNAHDQVIELASQGTDTVDSAVSFRLGANVERLMLTGRQAINGTGNGFANVIHGNGAANHLAGAGDADQLSGGAGADVLDGGLGRDTLTGGGGHDTFVFDSRISGANVDHIADFSRGDHIELAAAVFAGIGDSGRLAAADFSADGRAHTADQHILYNAATGALSYDADGNGAGHAIHFATLDGHPTSVAADFLIG